MTTTLEYAQNADESAIRGSVASLHRHAFSAPAGLCAGDIIDGKLRVGHVIGSGGMGTVYAAHHLGLDKEVALKVMAGAGDPEAAARFLREARAVAKLETSAVARVLDVGATASGLRYIVMERLHGVDLGALVKSRGALPVREAVSLVLEACAPLEEAHALGIIHRDLKPQNLFLAETRSGRRVLKVLDFGVSSLAGADESLTAHDQVLGTPNFMSPEQLSGARAADARSDVYSLGGCLYALLAAKAPARGKSLADIVQSIRNGIPVRLDALRTDVSRELADVVERCLAKDALLRFPTMAALAAALRALSESESTARDESEQHIDDVAILAMQEGLLGLETLHSWQQHFGICADCRELVAVTAPPSSGTITVVAPSSAPGRKLATTAPPVSVAPPSPSISPPVSRTTWIALTVFAIALAALVALGVQPRERPRVGPVPSARMAVVIGASPGAGRLLGGAESCELSTRVFPSRTPVTNVERRALRFPFTPERSMNTAVQLSHDDYLVAEARREWPTVQVPPHVFGAFIAARLDPSLGYEDALAALRIADLYIACACVSGDVHAIGAFELRYFQEVANAIRRVGRATLSLDDLRQLLRERLFVTTRERPARINEYRGTGSLRAWLRVTAGRLALNAATRAPREMRRPSEALAELVSTGESPELALFKRKYKSEFRDAVLAALSAIDAADRTLLVQAHAEGLSIDRIGAIYGIHRATAARRLERAREAFALATRAALASRLGGASDAEVDSIIDLVRSRFDLTLGGFFRGA